MGLHVWFLQFITEEFELGGSIREQPFSASRAEQRRFSVGCDVEQESFAAERRCSTIVRQLAAPIHLKIFLDGKILRHRDVADGSFDIG